MGFWYLSAAEKLLIFFPHFAMRLWGGGRRELEVSPASSSS